MAADCLVLSPFSNRSLFTMAISLTSHKSYILSSHSHFDILACNIEQTLSFPEYVHQAIEPHLYQSLSIQQEDDHWHRNNHRTLQTPHNPHPIIKYLQ